MNPTQSRLLAFIAELELQHGRAHPRVRSMAGALGVSERAIQYHLRQLSRTGLIKITPRKTRTGKQLTSFYTLTEAGKAVVSLASGVKRSEAVEAAFHTLFPETGVKLDSASGVNPVKLDSASGVKEANTGETPTSTGQTETGVKLDSASGVQAFAPLNKETPETTGGAQTAALEGRPTEPPPHMLTSSEVANQYIRDKWTERTQREPTGLEKQMAILEARWAATKRGEA